MSEEIRVAGARDLRGTVDGPDADVAVVACPPHPRMGGSRTDSRLRAVGESLSGASVACLRFDYGPWDDGVGEQDDAATALAYARDRYDRVGLFGYSFGAGVALLTAADREPQPAAVSVLAPPARLVADDDTASAVDRIDCPLQVQYGERDSTVDPEPVAARARDRGADVTAVPADHFFVGQLGKVTRPVATFFAETLR